MFLGSFVPSSISVPGIGWPAWSTCLVFTFSYTYSVSPFGSFLVSTTLYPGIVSDGFLPSLDGTNSLPFLSTNTVSGRTVGV